MPVTLFRPAAVASGIAALALATFGQEAEPVALPKTLVTGTRIIEEPETTASPVTVLSRELIDQRQLNFLVDVLRGEPGLDVARSGQPGSLASVFLRGSSSAQTLVLVDGVPVNSAFNNTFDFASLSIQNVQQVEVLRGPQSTLYGSEAMGGVINLVTRSGAEGISGAARLEYGSFDTLLARASLSLAEQGFSLSAEGGYTQSDNDRINSDFSNPSFSGRMGYRFNDRWSLGLLGTWQRNDAGVPNDRFTDDPNDRLTTESYLVALTLEGTPAPWWTAKLIASHGHEGAVFDQPPPNPPYLLPAYASDTQAQRQSVDFQNIFAPAEHHKILAGMTWKHDRADFADTYAAFQDTIDNVAGYLQYEFAPIERLTLTAGGRVDDFSSFGTHATYRAGVRGTVPGSETILRANVGSGFRAPSIRELYWPVYGNPNLKPEESVGWDIGVEQPLLDNRLRAGVTFFHNEYTDLINGFPPLNVSGARALGIESHASWRPLTNLTVRVAYTWLDARDTSDDSRLDRRPEHRGSANVNYEFLKGLAFNFNALVVGERPDSDYSTFPPGKVTLPAYARLDVGLRWQACRHFALYGRIENLTDESYEEAYGFPALGRSFTLGATTQF